MCAISSLGKSKFLGKAKNKDTVGNTTENKEKKRKETENIKMQANETFLN